MPELPEVESVRRMLDRGLIGSKIVSVQTEPDELVFENSPDEIRSVLEGQRVLGTGRKGKVAWIETSKRPYLFFHLGMTGWVREIGAETEKRLVSHGAAPLENESGKPRFLKLLLVTDAGRKFAFTDGRRLARIWLSNGPIHDARVSALGPDALDELPTDATFSVILSRRTAPVKAVLMDQSLISGIGNWVADEVLYHARIAPNTPANQLDFDRIHALVREVEHVIQTAVAADALPEKFPPGWLFHRRWGGSRGETEIEGLEIQRDTVGGRTTAWVPEVQK